jgi:hypothetical protein
VDAVLHDVPVAQIYALNACHAWGEGLSVSGANYEDMSMLDELEKIMAAKAEKTP